MEKALSKLHAGRPIHLRAASRTDSGVHARGQVASYVLDEGDTIESSLGASESAGLTRGESNELRGLTTTRQQPLGGDPQQIMNALNRMLPDDVKVVQAFRAPPQQPHFHPTFDSVLKEYSYVVDTSPAFLDPLNRRFRWHCPGSAVQGAAGVEERGWLSRAVRDACDALVGTHDFEAFRSAPRGSARKQARVSAVCTLTRVEVHPLSTSQCNGQGYPMGRMQDPDEHAFRVVVVGDRFVYKMVRNIVGCLAEVAQGSRTVASIRRALENKRWGALEGENAVVVKGAGGEEEHGGKGDDQDNQGSDDGDGDGGWVEMDCPCSDFGSQVEEEEEEERGPKDALKPVCAPPHGLCLEKVLYEFDVSEGNERAEKEEEERGALPSFSLVGNDFEVAPEGLCTAPRGAAASFPEVAAAAASTTTTTSTTTTSVATEARCKDEDELPTNSGVPAMASSPPTVDRRPVVTHLGAGIIAAALSVASSSLFAPLSSANASPSSSSSSSASEMKALVAVVRTQAKVAELERPLAMAVTEAPTSSETADKEQQQQQQSSSLSRASEVSTALGSARRGAKEAVNAYKLRENTALGVSFLRATKGRQAAEAAEAHAFSAIEYLSSIVEFDALDDLRNDYTGRLARDQTTDPGKVQFALRAARAAARELKLFAACFEDQGAYSRAQELVRTYSDAGLL